MANGSRGNGHRVLITGGGRGLGAAIGQRLAADGMTVGLLARTDAEIHATVEAISEAGGRALTLPCDVLDRRQLDESAARFRSWAGGIDALVCAAGGIQAVGPFRAVDFDVWRLDFETAVVGVAQTIRAALPDLTDSGQASVSVLVGPGHGQALKNASGYAASQAALVRMVESLSHELAAEDVFLYAVNPGIVPTQMIRRLIDTPEGRRWLPQFNEAFAEGKEVPATVAAAMISWLIERRPIELNGRVVAALADPEFLETRLSRILDEDLSVLRLR
jgi:NAD(P)-dependent dehydrogenase (short-subunit alcohol dehydrogenase family)